MQVNWCSGMGNLTIIGWLTVAEYFVACVSCWMLSRKIDPTDSNALRERRIWLSIAILFFALGISRQLDLQTALTEVGRSIAHSEGWYNRRRIFQLAFIAGVSLTGLSVARALLIWARKTALLAQQERC